MNRIEMNRVWGGGGGGVGGDVWEDGGVSEDGDGAGGRGVAGDCAE